MVPELFPAPLGGFGPGCFCSLPPPALGAVRVGRQGTQRTEGAWFTEDCQVAKKNSPGEESVQQKEPVKSSREALVK